MNQCTVCSGLVPAHASSCPNCDVSRKSGLSIPKVAAFTALLVTTSYCAPVYGAPCTAQNGCVDPCQEQLADGGSPKNDSTNECFEDPRGEP